MKSLNAKRIAAVVTGAALLGMGLAFGGAVTYQNVPIISNSGQPVVQIVIGSTGKPSDGVAAANIAAAIGNLAYTSVPVTATVNATQAQQVLKVAVTGGSGGVSNAQVWLNESGAGGTAGTYTFAALIGSVLNGAVLLNAPQNTKMLQSGAGTQYAYQQLLSLTISPVGSPYTASSFVPIQTSVTPSYNGGGASFSGFTAGTPKFDNILLVGSSQFPGLLNNWGTNGESEWLWLTGFPVFNQQSGVNNFQLLDAGGAYQVTFSKPIQNTISNGGSQINVPIVLLGQNWTILTANSVGVGTVTSSNTINGGKLQLASSLVPMQTVYVGKNITTTPLAGQTWTVLLQDLGQPNSNGISPASVAIYLNGALTNTSSISPGTTAKFNVTGKTLYVNVNQTFAGLYAYQKWAKMQVYSNVFNITDGKVFNKTTNPGWTAQILWTNTTSASASAPRALQSIIVYNTTPTNLAPGQSFTFIQNPASYKLTFLGDTLGAAGFDTVTAATSYTGSTQYENIGSAGSFGPGSTITNVTEPAQLLTVTSGIPSAFSYAGQTSSSVQYILTPFLLNENANALLSVQPVNVGSGGAIPGANVFLLDANLGGSSWITSTYPLTVTVTGYSSNTASSPITQSVTFTANSANTALSTPLWNVTAIGLNKALPGGPSTIVVSVNAINVVTGNSVNLATLKSTAPGVLYQQSGKVYQSLSQAAATSVIYNQQNGQPTTTWVLTQNTVPSGTPAQYFTYTINEIAVPTNTAALDTLTFGIDNSTAGVTAGSGSVFQLNYSAAGTRMNVTYKNSTNGGVGTALNAGPGFRTERGSKVASITPNTDTFSIAKLADTLQFAVGAASTTVTGKAYKMYGPYGVGQGTNIPNVSIGSVTANVVLAGGSYTITGISNITATPSVATATQPVWLNNLGTTPLVVLDSNANAGSNLILIGSGFVNSLSSQLQRAYNVSMTPTTQITQAYGTNRILVAGYYANQTTAAANIFIQQLYAQAH